MPEYRKTINGRSELTWTQAELVLEAIKMINSGYDSASYRILLEYLTRIGVKDLNYG